MTQTFQNHRRFYPLFHFFLVPVAFAAFVVSIWNTSETTDYTHVSISFLFFLVLVTAYTARTSALKAQDRAIRAEMSLRYFILSGKMIPAELRMGQIVALRFASDAEVIALTERAAKDQLSAKQIKQEITNWKGDYNRV